jgi:hypothetical protein
MIDEISALNDPTYRLYKEREKRNAPMTHPAPHAKRCETCDHYTDGNYYDLCAGIVMEPIGIFDWVKTHGCASHCLICPSPQSPICDRCIADQEPFCIGCYRLKQHNATIRNATLDLIIKFRTDNAKEYKIHDMWVAEAEYLQSLRKEQP